jgi:hypothetical protein
MNSSGSRKADQLVQKTPKPLRNRSKRAVLIVWRLILLGFTDTRPGSLNLV